MKQMNALIAIAGMLCGNQLCADDDARLRQQLENVLAYHRLASGGGRLASATYRAYAEEFSDAGRPPLQRIAGCFQGLAAMELGDWETAASLLESTTDDNADPTWLSRLRTADVGNAEIVVETPVYQEARLRFRSSIEQATKAFESDAEEAIMLAGENSEPFNPSLILKVDEQVEVEYRFFDAALFRLTAADQIQALSNQVSAADTPEGLLVKTWCEILLGRIAPAARITATIKATLRDQLNAAQNEELQFLMVAIAAENGQAEVVTEFLDSRRDQQPESLWAQRALNLIDDQAQTRLAILQARCSKRADGQHPFSRHVLGNSAEQTSAILDEYWEVAWVHRTLAVQADEGKPVPTQPALRTRRLVEELVSPTVLEAWRPLSMLRLELIFEAGLLTRDTETWQLFISDTIKLDHPVWQSVIRMSRDYSGLMRTRGGNRDYRKLDGDLSDNVVTLLWGGGGQAAVTVPVGQPQTAQSDRGRTLPVAFVIIVLLVLLFVGIRAVRGNVR